MDQMKENYIQKVINYIFFIEFSKRVDLAPDRYVSVRASPFSRKGPFLAGAVLETLMIFLQNCVGSHA